jgi:type II secretory ATPase GspE/PulE/Tfp pilus assembly ATPase PilB-like protein
MAAALSALHLGWAGAWPLPSWLAATPVDTSTCLVRLAMANDKVRTGVLKAAIVEDRTLTLTWAGQEQTMVLPWDEVGAVSLLARLDAGAVEFPQPAQGPWDARIPHQLLPFHLRMSPRHGLADIKGNTMGFLSASYGLYLYVEHADGSFRGEWVSSAALAFVQVGTRIWHTGSGRATDRSALPAPPGDSSPHELQPMQAATPLVDASASWPMAPATTVGQLLAATDFLRHHAVAPVVMIIAALGYVSEEVLAGKTSNGVPSGYLLGDLLEERLLTLEQSHHILSRLGGVPEADLEHFEVAPEAAALTLNDARRFDVFPLGATADCFFVASSNPTRQELVLLLSSLLNRHVQLVWAPAASIVGRLGGTQAPWLAAAVAAPAPEVASARRAGEKTIYEEDLATLLTRATAEADADPRGERATDLVEVSSFVMLVRRVIEDAVRLDASDIHVETNPGAMLTQIRLRRDGDLEPYLSLPASLRAPLVSRIKVMARLDIAEHRRPQDGKINFAEYGGSKLELRVAVLPTHDGLEDVVMRLLASSKPIPLARLGLQARDEAKVLEMTRRSFGLILAAGPTGSGKTTTLHSMLKHLNVAKLKIWTAEDPIEITQQGLRQVQVNPKIGLTFASAMRAFLRADPDVIMIGEIRDEETAKTTVEASLTGHLVLSTLHTNSAAESVVRLLDLGLDPLVYADSLVGIVAQRLVRALCSHCATSRPLEDAQLDALVGEYIGHTSLSAAEGRRRLVEAGAAHGSAGGLAVSTAVGCAVCSGKGYKGRMGIYEVLENTPTLHGLIQRRARPAEIFDAAIADGMRSLRHDAMEKLVQGKIDLLQARAAYA